MQHKKKREDEHTKRKTLLEQSEISLLLDTYDDIFSDFDPRPYSERALSDDFLLEAKKASKDKESGKVELEFLIPKHLKNTNQEYLIKKRLRAHFKKHHTMLIQEKKAILKEGIIFTVAGILLMIVATYILSSNLQKTFATSFIIILLEPGGWFLFWTGLDKIVLESKKFKPDIEFYEKMSRAKMHFLSY